MSKQRKVRYFERDTWNEREGEVIERNGALTYIEDKETGERDWYCDFEISKRDKG